MEFNVFSCGWLHIGVVRRVDGWSMETTPSRYASMGGEGTFHQMGQRNRQRTRHKRKMSRKLQMLHRHLLKGEHLDSEKGCGLDDDDGVDGADSGMEGVEDDTLLVGDRVLEGNVVYRCPAVYRCPVVCKSLLDCNETVLIEDQETESIEEPVACRGLMKDLKVEWKGHMSECFSFAEEDSLENLEVCNLMVYRETLEESVSKQEVILVRNFLDGIQ